MKKPLCDKIESLLELDIDKKYKILDIGCGRGELLENLANSVDPGSTLIGIDEMSSSIKYATDNWPRLEFQCQKFIDSLPFGDSTFDIVISVDMLECIPNKAALLNEVKRVLKPDGTVLFAHWDWDTQIFNSKNIPIIRKFVAAFSDWQQEWMDDADGQMGRRLWGLFEGSGKFRGRVASFTLLETNYCEGQYGFDRLEDLSNLIEVGEIDSTEYDLICGEMRSLSEQNRYLYSVNSYIYVGKPHNNRQQPSRAQ